jgi:uncharacterized LabA/DUF88 family protein
MARVMAFIDGSNFYHGLKKSLGQTNVDFLKFGRKLAGTDRLIGIAYYNSPRRRQDGATEYRDQQRFFKYLETVPGLTVHLGRLEPRTRSCPKCNETYKILVEKDVDVNVAVDMLAGAFDDLYDMAVLVTGDGDFHRLITAVRKVGKIVNVAYFAKGQARALSAVCNEFVLLDTAFMTDCWR